MTIYDSIIFYAVPIASALLYAAIGYVASKEKFDVKKFLLTLFVQLASAFGLTLTGADVYLSTISASVITYYVTKIVNMIFKKS